jgi:ABC-type dipeptide/oligopeptide/nickel transport system permease component
MAIFLIRRVLLTIPILLIVSIIVFSLQVFSIPGFGRLIVESIFNRDFTMVQGAVLVAACIVVSVNILVDILYAFIDPRIKLVASEAR